MGLAHVYRETGCEPALKSAGKMTRYSLEEVRFFDAEGRFLSGDPIQPQLVHFRGLRIAQRRANQENLIKDFKYGPGLSYVPTGFLLANKIYFKIAALAWNIITWMLNLLDIGNVLGS